MTWLLLGLLCVVVGVMLGLDRVFDRFEQSPPDPAYVPVSSWEQDQRERP